MIQKTQKFLIGSERYIEDLSFMLHTRPTSVQNGFFTSNVHRARKKFVIRKGWSKTTTGYIMVG